MLGKTFRIIGFIVVFTFCALTNFGQTAKIDSLMSLLPQNRGAKLGDLYLELSKEYNYFDPSKAVYYANEGLAIAKESKNREQECESYLGIGLGHISSGNFEEGREFAQKGIDLALELQNEESVVIGMTILAAYYLELGQYSDALDLFLRSLMKAENLQLEERVAKIRLNIGALLSAKGDRVTGLRYLLDALAYYEVHKDANVEANILRSVAANYYYWKDYDKALEYYKKALEAENRLHDLVRQAIAYNNIGEIYKNKGNYDKAAPYYEKVIDLADQIENGDYYKAYGWIGLAEVYLHTRKYRESDYYIGLALAVFEEVKMQEGIATANCLLAQISMKLKYPKQALREIKICRDIARKNGIFDLVKQSYHVESEILAELGDYREAYTKLKQYSLITDTLYAQERTINFAQARSELEMTQKQNEIELLQKDNQIKDLRIRKQKTNTLILSFGVVALLVVFLIMLGYIKSRKKANDLLTDKNRKIRLQHKELLKVNETKDKFMSIIGHDLRNPIGAFKDVVGQLADFPEMFTDELRQQIINELRDEAESTYFLLDNLLSWAKSQKDAINYKPQRTDISMIVQNNIQLNFRFAEIKRIKVTAEVEAGLMAYADHNMVNLILRNLISNAIKFTEEGGLIEITTREKGKMIVTSVKDTGVGISRDNLPKIFDSNAHVSTYGTKHEKGSGLGLLLCKEFVETNGGSITVDSEKGKGSIFSFTLKKYPGANQVEVNAFQKQESD